MTRRQTSPRESVGAGEWPSGAPADRGAAYAQAVASSVREELKRRGWSLREVARHAGLSHVTVSNIVAGTTWPDLSTLARLEGALGTELLPTGRLGMGPDGAD